MGPCYRLRGHARHDEANPLPHGRASCRLWAEALARATAWFAHRLLATRQIWMERHGIAQQFVFDREDCASKLDSALEHLQCAAADAEVQGGRGQRLPGTAALEQWLGRPAPTELLLALRLRVARDAGSAGAGTAALP